MATTNTLFALFAIGNPQEVEAKLEDLTPWLYLPVASGQWLIITPHSVTTKELSDKLGISGGTVSTGMLARVENYWGHLPSSVWEWITAKIGVPLDATSE